MRNTLCQVADYFYLMNNWIINFKYYPEMSVFFQIQFDRKVYPDKIEIYETYNSGAVKKLQLMQPDNKWYTVWQTDAVQSIKILRTFSPHFEVSTYMGFFFQF